VAVKKNDFLGCEASVPWQWGGCRNVGFFTTTWCCWLP
jgi:hypothetical protein